VQVLTTTTTERDLSDWDLAVKQVQNALNTMHNKNINTTPMKAFIGCETSIAESLLAKIQDVGWTKMGCVTVLKCISI